jgi:hypothetical protein
MFLVTGLLLGACTREVRGALPDVNGGTSNVQVDEPTACEWASLRDSIIIGRLVAARAASEPVVIADGTVSGVAVETCGDGAITGYALELEVEVERTLFGENPGKSVTVRLGTLAAKNLWPPFSPAPSGQIKWEYIGERRADGTPQTEPFVIGQSIGLALVRVDTSVEPLAPVAWTHFGRFFMEDATESGERVIVFSDGTLMERAPVDVAGAPLDELTNALASCDLPPGSRDWTLDQNPAATYAAECTTAESILDPAPSETSDTGQ